MLKTGFFTIFLLKAFSKIYNNKHGNKRHTKRK